MVPGAAGLLLHYCGQRLCHHSACHRSARTTGDSSTNSFPDATAHATTHAATDTPPDASTYTSGAFWASGPIQLRCGCRKYLGSRQESVVLQSPPSRVPSHRATTSTDLATSAANLATGDANNATRPGGPIQLC